jgi:hypothetical protein
VSSKGAASVAVDARTRTAYHEAGHAVLSAAIGNPPKRVTISANAYTLGRSVAPMSDRPTARVQVYLAGFAAEHLLTGRRPRQLDQEIGFSLVARRDPTLGEAYAGSGSRDGHRAVEEVLRVGTYPDDEAIRREVDRFYQVARGSLSAVWSSVKAVASVLLRDGAMDRRGFEEALGDVDLWATVMTVRGEPGLLRAAGVNPSVDATAHAGGSRTWSTTPIIARRRST